MRAPSILILLLGWCVKGCLVLLARDCVVTSAVRASWSLRAASRDPSWGVMRRTFLLELLM